MTAQDLPIVHAHFSVPKTGVWDVEISTGCDSPPFKWRGKATSIEDAQEKAQEAWRASLQRT